MVRPVLTMILLCALAAPAPAAAGANHRLRLITKRNERHRTFFNKHSRRAITVLVNTSEEMGRAGHTSVIVGDKAFEVYGSRHAEASRASSAFSFSYSTIGSLYRVPEKAVPLYQRHFEDMTLSMNRHNFPPFTFTGKSYVLEPRSEGRWAIRVKAGSKRSEESRRVEAQLVERNGRAYLESPNLAEAGQSERRVQIPVSKQADGSVVLAGRSCAQHVFDALNEVAAAHPAMQLPTFHSHVAARAVAAGIVRGSLSPGRKPDMTLQLSLETDKRPTLKQLGDSIRQVADDHEPMPGPF